MRSKWKSVIIRNVCHTKRLLLNNHFKHFEYVVKLFIQSFSFQNKLCTKKENPIQQQKENYADHYFAMCMIIKFLRSLYCIPLTFQFPFLMSTSPLIGRSIKWWAVASLINSPGFIRRGHRRPINNS